MKNSITNKNLAIIYSIFILTAIFEPFYTIYIYIDYNIAFKYPINIKC